MSFPRSEPSNWPPDSLETIALCPACLSHSLTPLHAGLRDRLFGAAGVWSQVRCGNCGSVSLTPRPDEASIADAYRTYYTHENPDAPSRTLKNRVGDAIREAWRNDYLNRTYGYRLAPALPGGQKRIASDPIVRSRADRHVLLLPAPTPENDRLLDIGCGNGDLMERLQTLGWKPTGIDPDSAAIDACRRRGIDASVGMPTEKTLPVGPFHAIALSHVIEHSHDPEGLLRLALSRLSPGGLLYLETPQASGLGHARFGTDWRGLEPPRHLTVFSATGLTAICERAGFVVERVQGFPTLRWLAEQSATIRARRLSGDDTSTFDPDALAADWAQLGPKESSTVDSPELADVISLLARKPS